MLSDVVHHVNYFPLGRGGIFSSGILVPFKVRLNTKKLLSSTYNLPPEHFTPPLLYSDSVKIITLLYNSQVFLARFCALPFLYFSFSITSHLDSTCKSKQENCFKKDNFELVQFFPFKLSRRTHLVIFRLSLTQCDFASHLSFDPSLS